MVFCSRLQQGRPILRRKFLCPHNGKCSSELGSPNRDGKKKQPVTYHLRIHIVIARFSVFDEVVEMDDVFELRVGVQEEVVSEGAEFLEVGDQIVYAICNYKNVHREHRALRHGDCRRLLNNIAGLRVSSRTTPS